MVNLLFGAITEFHRLEPPKFSLWLALAGGLTVLLGCLFGLLGRLVYLDWRPNWLLGSLAGIALPVSFVVLVLLPASTYLKPAVATILETWQVRFSQDNAWNQETFRQEYWAVHRLNKENFTAYPPPEDGGHRIPAIHPDSKAAIADIDSRRVSDHFQEHYSLLARLLWTSERPLPELIKTDIDRFFSEHPETDYEHSKAVQLVGAEMLNLLELKIGRIVSIVRLILVSILMGLWLPLCAGAIYDAWKRLEPIRGLP